MRTEKLKDIINKDDKDLMKMIEFIKRNNRKGFNNSSRFKTFTLETSRGKTIGSAFAMSESILNGNKTKYVFTTKTKEECKRVAELIQNELKDTFEGLEDNVVMWYTPKIKEDTDISSGDFYKCCKAKVLIITHSTYLNLCSPNTNEHKKYSKMVKNIYHTLIVDEELNAVTNNLCIFNNYVYENTLRLIKSTNNTKILTVFDNLCNILKDTITLHENIENRIVVAEKEDSEIFSHMKYEYLIKSIQKIDNEVIHDYNSENDMQISKSDIIEEIKKIYTVYQNIDFEQVLYWNGSLYSCDFNFKYLMLEKNIMLDASANFNTIYDNKLFNVVKSKRVINHQKCYLIWHNINTSKSAKRKDSDKEQLTEWRKFIIDDIQKKTIKDRLVLIITNKSECDGLEDRFIDYDFKEHFEEYAFLNFFNMRGVDDYAQYDDCFIIHTHRFPFPVYILEYMYYMMEDDMNINDLNMGYGKFRGSNAIGFEDKTLDSIMFSDEVSSIYQGCKRICRSEDPKGNFHIYNSNFEIVKAIQKELHEVKIIPDEDNKKAKLIDDFYFLIDRIRTGEYKDYKVKNGRTKKKVKAVKKKGAKYLEVNRKLFYEVLNIDKSSFAKNIKNIIDEKECGVKFEKSSIIVSL